MVVVVSATKERGAVRDIAAVKAKSELGRMKVKWLRSVVEGGRQ